MNLLIDGAIYHISSRGHERRDIFRADRDRQRFLETLAENTEAYHNLPNMALRRPIRQPVPTLGRPNVFPVTAPSIGPKGIAKSIPWPVLILIEPHGIKVNIATHLQQLGVALDQLRAIRPLEYI